MKDSLIQQNQMICYRRYGKGTAKRFRKMNIHDLMDSQKQNEEILESHGKSKRLLFSNIQVLILFLSGLVLAVYLMYTGISAWIFCYVRDKGNAV